MAKSEEELKSLLMRIKEKNEKTNLKLNIKKQKIMTEAAGGAVGAPLQEQAGSWLSAPAHVCASLMFPMRVGLWWGDLDWE